MQLAALPDEGQICQITVLPFINQTESKTADTLFYRIFTSELLSTGNYLISQEGDVRKILRQMRVFIGQQTSLEQVRSLGGRLGSKIVVSGTIIEMSGNDEQRGRQPVSLAVILRIIETDSGRTLWSTYHRREAKQYQKFLHFGKINTIAELSKVVSQEIITAWINKGLKICVGK